MVNPWLKVAGHLLPVLASLPEATSAQTRDHVEELVLGATYEEMQQVDLRLWPLCKESPAPTGNPFALGPKDHATRPVKAKQERLARQYALRVCFAIDVCVHYPALRQGLCWTGFVQRDSRMLLVPNWYDGAYYWLDALERYQRRNVRIPSSCLRPRV